MYKKYVNSVGIIAYGSYVPHLKMAVSEVDRAWGNLDLKKISAKKAELKKQDFYKAVADKDEDVNTFSLNIASNILHSFPKLQTHNIGSIYVGSESFVYAVKPVASILGDFLGIREFTGADVQFACKAGTAAMQIVTAQVAGGTIKAGLCLGIDVSQAKVGDVLERNVGAGGAGFVVGNEKGQMIAKIVCTASLTSDTPDFWRRAGEKVPVHTSRFSGSVGYVQHVSDLVRLILEKTGNKPKDFKYVILHSPNIQLPDFIGQKFGFCQQSMVHKELFPKIGNAFAGSTMLGLAHTLDKARPNDLILLISYGSGAGSDAFIFQATKNIENNRAKTSLLSQLKNRTEIDYLNYLKNLKIL
ncbi:hydroxymethylglutaryl-CoA synthase [Patescibacteria group bacterium]|nr:hydroxymethylglutaryl-CoA synthase [Patescibacteria group bacterium]